TGENPKWISYDNEGKLVPNYDDFYTLHEGYMPDGRSGMSNGITQGGSNADMVVVSRSIPKKNFTDNINWTLAYEALLKGAKGFILPRFVNGSFDTSWNVFNLSENTPYYEGSAWEYRPQAFERRLDKTFENKSYLTAYFNIGNEPDFFHPCLYHFIGKQWKSVEVIRDILEKKFGKGPELITYCAMLLGNDDLGAMG
ncbi:12969_t:CDS:2, partial [Racocetra fulgida]